MNKSSFIISCILNWTYRRLQFHQSICHTTSNSTTNKIGSKKFIIGLYRDIFKILFQPRTNKSITLVWLKSQPNGDLQILQGASKCLLPFPLVMVAVLPVVYGGCDTDKSCPVKEDCNSSPPAPPISPPKPSPLPYPPKVACECFQKYPASCPPGPTNRAQVGNTNCSSSSQLKWEQSELSHEYLVKQACIVAVDAVTRILTETVSALQDYHCQYREKLNAMIDMLNEYRNAYDDNQELIHCRMIVTRSELDQIRRMIVELECYLNSVENLARCTAEVAFIGRAEYASIALSERLESILLEARTIKATTTELERDMNELQALIIVESGNSLIL